MYDNNQFDSDESEQNTESLEQDATNRLKDIRFQSRTRMLMDDEVFNAHQPRIPLRLNNKNRYPSQMHNEAIKKLDLKIANNWGPNYSIRKYQQPVITTSKLFEMPVDHTTVLVNSLSVDEQKFVINKSSIGCGVTTKSKRNLSKFKIEVSQINNLALFQP